MIRLAQPFLPQVDETDAFQRGSQAIDGTQAERQPRVLAHVRQ